VFIYLRCISTKTKYTLTKPELTMKAVIKFHSLIKVVAIVFCDIGKESHHIPSEEWVFF
jgi:hypothetical protein